MNISRGDKNTRPPRRSVSIFVLRNLLPLSLILALAVVGASQTLARDMARDMAAGIPPGMPSDMEEGIAINATPHLPSSLALPIGPSACPAADDTVQVQKLDFCPVALPSGTPPPSSQSLIRYRILVERGLEDQAQDFIDGVTSILGGESGWTRDGVVFAHVTKDYDLTVLLARPASVDRLCLPLRTGGWLSCAIRGRAIINALRWKTGADTWGKDITGYRHYLVRHEVGHVLGLRHIECPNKGEPAPVMLPQTKFLHGCEANGEVTPQDNAMLTRLMPAITKRLQVAGVSRFLSRPYLSTKYSRRRALLRRLSRKKKAARRRAHNRRKKFRKRKR